MSLAPAKIRERDVEWYLCKQVRIRGGVVRKMKWLGHDGAPDRFIALNQKTVLVETKRPGEKARPNQQREHDRLRAQGVDVRVIDTMEGVDNFIREIMT